MKKVFAILAICSFIASCNNSSEEKTTTATDSTITESPLMDAVSTADSANKIIHDSTHQMMDTSHKK